MAKEIKASDIIGKATKKLGGRRDRHREINLVPDIKNEMIKTIKLRNLIFFLCIIVASASVATVVVFGTIVGGQTLIIDSKDNSINALSSKIKDYKDLNEFLTIKDQVSNIGTITDEKKVFSRAFNIINAIIPTGADYINISDANINLETDSPTLSIEAQANAGTEPYIDYRVLDAFKKSMEYLTFDYGEYVDRDGNAIPAYCVIDTGEDGSTFRDERNNLYGLWTFNADGCSTNNNDDDSDDGSNNNKFNTSGYEVEDYQGQQVIRIWRTPQLDWYRAVAPTEGQPYMTEDGVIKDVAHFDSKCIKYKVELRDSNAVKIDESNNSCKLVPLSADGDDSTSGINIPADSSSNGRDASNQLVLRFDATITLNPEVFNFSNQHYRTIPPSSRRNVTDSYVQLQSIFAKRASDCAQDDADCRSEKNKNGGN